VVVHHSDRLHERVANRRPYESKPLGDERLAHRGGFFGHRGKAPQRLPRVHLWRPTDELPQKRIERFARVDHLEKGASIPDGGPHFLAVPNDAWVFEDLGDAASVIARHHFRIEAVEGAEEAVPLTQNDRPRESRLKPVQDQLAEELPVVVYRHAPLGVVVRDHLLVIGRPGAARVHSFKLEEAQKARKMFLALCSSGPVLF